MNSIFKKIVVAIDGVTASGKGSVAELLSKEFNLDYLDTGLLYRAVGYFMLKQNLTLNNLVELLNIVNNLNLTELGSLSLKNETIAQKASMVAKVPEVRKALFYKQVNFVNKIRPEKNGVILDGRDIGTVICPKADIKFFFTAKLEIRARRRYNQLKLTDPTVNFLSIQNAITDRDKSDKCINNLALDSKDYIVIDNSNLTLHKTFELCKNYVKSCMISKISK